MPEDKTNIDEIKSEELSDDKLNEVVGGASTMFTPFIPWLCQCGYYNNVKLPDSHICKGCGQSRPPK